MRIYASTHARRKAEGMDYKIPIDDHKLDIWADNLDDFQMLCERHGVSESHGFRMLVQMAEAIEEGRGPSKAEDGAQWVASFRKDASSIPREKS